MLIEFTNINQKEADRGIFRRWFGDEFFDLIVWYDTQHTITGFQLCYNRIKNPHALTWKRDEGIYHDKIDEGRAYHDKLTPILVADGLFRSDIIYDKFAEASSEIEEQIRNLVLNKIKEYDSYR